MFSDTHFHFRTMLNNSGETPVDGSQILAEMARRDCFLGLDIGTRADDLVSRKNCLENAILQIEDEALREKARQFVYFSAGIWPDVDSIHDWKNKISILEQSIAESNQLTNEKNLNHRIIAIGEGGIDHHWNPSGVDGRCESDFDQKTYDGERNLFEAQLTLAKKMDLPMIVHSRDGYEDTLSCIKNVGWNKGIIHCYSYGLEEAKVFLDLGWYISFSGSVTYTKKNKMEDMIKLLSYIPEDRILCETDAPYLAPVPMRGNPNNPVFVEHTYRFVAQARGISPEELSNTVDKNSKNLFGIN